MDKFVSLVVLAAVGIVLALTVTAEAAWPVRVLGPRVKVMVNKTSDMIWRNKGTITTGVLLMTFATNPEPFVEGATTVACTATEKTIETVVPNVAEQIREPTSKTGAYLILAGILAAIGTVIVFRQRFQPRAGRASFQASGSPIDSKLLAPNVFSACGSTNTMSVRCQAYSPVRNWQIYARV